MMARKLPATDVVIVGLAGPVRFWRTNWLPAG